MAAVDPSKLSEAEKGELLCTYASLILHDDKADLTAENINKLITSSGGKVESYLPGLFMRLFQSVDIGTLLQSIGSGGGGAAAAPVAAAGGAPAAAAKGAPAAAAAPEEEEEAAMEFDLFD
eukprot:GHVR01192595.1.p1 GENE.GHVR01192595.1~~GHVR01192595.1.p1  ORF type:complete len:121 (+),score=44.82 GHVR01192595.1:35-397(+)